MPNSEVVSAFLSYTVDELEEPQNTQDLTSIVYAEPKAAALPSKTKNDLSSRKRTASSVTIAWAPHTKDGAMAKTPDLSVLLNEVFASPAWKCVRDHRAQASPTPNGRAPVGGKRGGGDM